MDLLCCLYLVFVMLSRLFIAALWSPEGKGLTSGLLFVMIIVILLLSNLGIQYAVRKMCTKIKHDKPDNIVHVACSKAKITYMYGCVILHLFVHLPLSNVLHTCIYQTFTPVPVPYGMSTHGGVLLHLVVHLPID